MCKNKCNRCKAIDVLTSSANVDTAKAFCIAAHSAVGQKRKYTREPYYNHPIAVAKLVQAVPHTEDMIMAALLHDVVEDTEVTINLVRHMFGSTVAKLVDELTDKSTPEDGNRAKRKAIDLANLAKASPQAKTIKLADLIDNTSSIVQYDPDFAKIYMLEKRELLKVLTEGDETLYNKAKSIVDEYYLEEGR